MKHIFIVLLLIGCVTEHKESEFTIVVPSDSVTDKEIITRIGHLSNTKDTPPIRRKTALGIFYFDIDESGLKRRIMVSYPLGGKIPAEHDRKIEIKGVIFIEAERAIGTGKLLPETITLHRWKYLE
jgi:hypothetical protein